MSTNPGSTNYYALIVREMARSMDPSSRQRDSRTLLTFDILSFQSNHSPTPPRAAAIVRYLDYVDRRVRRYVEAKRKLIALLEEERQAVIHQAVTRGLDPNVPLKPSGVEWLGDIPEHWERRRLKTILQIMDLRSTTGNEILLSLHKGLRRSCITLNTLLVPHRAGQQVGFKLVCSGQLVLNRLQANNGLIWESTLDGLVSPDYSVLPKQVASCNEVFERPPYGLILIGLTFARELQDFGTGLPQALSASL